MKKKEKKSEFYDRLRKVQWKYTADFGPTTKARYRIILNLVSKFSSRKDISLIDVGCGSGNLLKLLQMKGYNNIQGSDFSCESVKISTRKLGNIISKIDLTTGKFIRNQFDIVICSEVIEHIENDDLSCKTIMSLLKKDGIAIISVPVNTKYWSLHDAFSGHVRRYQPNELESLLFSKGFSIEYTHYWGSGIYSLYHFFLRQTKPTSLMKAEKPTIFKIIIAKLLYFVFISEDYLNFSSYAKRLFVVVKKNG